MSKLGKMMVLASAIGGAMLAQPAQAALVVCASQACDGPTENVLFNWSPSTTQTGMSLLGETNITNKQVLFTADHTIQAKGGAAELSDLGGNKLTGTVLIDVLGYNFSSFEFNLQANNSRQFVDSGTVTFTILDADGNPYTTSLPYPTYNLNGSGQNWFSGHTTDGDVISSIEFTLNPVGSAVETLKQVRLGGFVEDQPNIVAVPEPATWLTMIMGFGAVGGMMRRRKQFLRTAAA